jgi:hypothetical protein
MSNSVLANQEAKGALETLHNLRLVVGKMNMYYHLASLEDADPTHVSILNESNKEAIDIANEVNTTLTALALETDAAAVQVGWEEYSNLLKKNRRELKRKGFAELQVVDQMHQSGRALTGQLTTSMQNINSKSGYQSSAIVTQARDLSLQMRQLAARYIERTTSSFGESFRSYGDEENIDRLALNFDQALKKLIVTSESSPDASSIVKSISLKWSFVEKSFVNYTENTIPFLVTRYSERIIKLLNELNAF